MIENEQLLFDELSKELEKHDIYLEVICAGGFVLKYHEIRATSDIDSFFKTNALIDSIIRQIGDKYGLNVGDELWLNNSIQNLNKRPPVDICSTIYDHENLKVMIPPLEYVACMKLHSAREIDIKDVGSILRKLDIKNPDKLEKILIKYGFTTIDDSLILESFANAFGMDWLAKYYEANEQKIIEKSELGYARYHKEHKPKSFDMER